LLSIGSIASGQTPGVTKTEILIGSCSALEGPSHALGTQQIKGAQAYFDLLNDEGGVGGRKLKLLAYDDSYDPAKAETCFNRLKSQNVFAMGLLVGTPTVLKYLPMAEEAKIPVVGLFTGAQTLYTPMRHWVVNVRASYAVETNAQIRGLWDGLGYRKIGVIYPDDSFGEAVLTGVRSALKGKGAEPVAAGSYQRQTSNAESAITTVRAANPEAVVLVGPANTAAPILKKMHAQGWKPLVVTVSFVGTDELILEAGRRRSGGDAGDATLLHDGVQDRGPLQEDDDEILPGRAAWLCEPGRFRGCDGDGGRPEARGERTYARKSDSWD